MGLMYESHPFSRLICLILLFCFEIEGLLKPLVKVLLPASMKDLPRFGEVTFVAESHSSLGALRKGIVFVNYYVFCTFSSTLYLFETSRSSTKGVA